MDKCSLGNEKSFDNVHTTPNDSKSPALGVHFATSGRKNIQAADKRDDQDSGTIKTVSYAVVLKPSWRRCLLALLT